MNTKNMRKLIATALLALGATTPILWADTDISRGSTGLTAVVADGLYGSLAGEAGWGGTQDFTKGTLLAGIASAVNEVMTQEAADARHPQLAAVNTFTKANLFPDGTSGAPSIGFASEPGTGRFLSKALRQAWTIDGTGTVMTLDTTNGLVVDVDVTFGNAIGDAATINAGTWGWANDTIFNFGSKVWTINSATGGLEINAPIVFDGTFEVKGTTGFELSIGAGVDAPLVAVGVTGVPTLGWLTASNSFEFTEGLFVQGRLQGAKGSDIASADEITLGADGNYFDITGTTTINHITKTNWQAGAVVVLQFDENVTVSHNAGSPAGTEASILLLGAGPFSATAGDTLQLVYDGTTFREVSRTVI